MKFRVVGSVTAEVLVKRAMYLAWKACGGPLGLGFLQDRPEATEEDVWKNITGAGDYSMPMPTSDGPGDAHADYVFGRMMKLGMKYEGQEIDVGRGDKPTPDYQAWCVVYPTVLMLLQVAAEELGAKVEVVKG